MANRSFSYRFKVDRRPDQVWAAVADPRSWWSKEIEGEPAREGAEFGYRYRDVHRCSFRVVESVPGRRLAWRVIDNAFNFTKDPAEWVGTEVVFELRPVDGGTELDFTHRGLVPEYECFAVCRDAWTAYLGGSLRDLILTGSGQPNPKDDLDGRAAALGPEDFQIRLAFPQAPAAVMAAVEDPRKWWSASIAGSAAKSGDEFVFSYKDVHRSLHRVTERIPGRLAVWTTLESHISFTKRPNEWDGSALVFEALPKDGGTELLFAHAGLRKDLECYAPCVEGWTYFVGESLAALLETGKGKPEE